VLVVSGLKAAWDGHGIPCPCGVEWYGSRAATNFRGFHAEGV